MTRFPTALTTWALVLAAAASGCAQTPAPVEEPAPTATTPASDDCECCGEKAKPKPAEVPAAGDLLKSPWLEPDARGGAVTSLKATDQDGQSLDLSDFRGKPLALTFLYTRCTNRNRCPLVATRAAQLQKLVEAAGLGDRVGLVVVTYDPDFDTPEILKKYGQARGLRFTPHVRMLRPDPGHKDDFFDRLRVTVNYGPEGVNIHGLQLFLLDTKGRFVRRYQSVIWDNADVLADLKRLADEAQ